MAIAPQERPGNSGDRNQSETRLLESATRLFSSKGYDATSVRDIIEDAGVTRPVLYYYFQNKEDLYTRLIEAQFKLMSDEIDVVVQSSEPFVEKLRALVRDSFRRAESSPETVSLLLQFFFSARNDSITLDRDALGRERFRHIVAVMTQGLELGEIAGGNPESLALVFVGFMDMPVIAKASQPEASLTREMADALVELFLCGASAANRVTNTPELAFEFDSENPAAPPRQQLGS